MYVFASHMHGYINMYVHMYIFLNAYASDNTWQHVPIMLLLCFGVPNFYLLYPNHAVEFKGTYLAAL